LPPEPGGRGDLGEQVVGAGGGDQGALGQGELGVQAGMGAGGGRAEQAVGVAVGVGPGGVGGGQGQGGLAAEAGLAGQPFRLVQVDLDPPGQQQLQQGAALAAGQPVGRDLAAVDGDREGAQHLHPEVAVATHPPIVVDQLGR
jgi:hypothetical protein